MVRPPADGGKHQPRGGNCTGITSVYLQGIDSSAIISTVHGRPSPTISASAGVQMRD
ncbi:MAG TPA: hypothetical protein VGI55_06575 [Solirubrobacteraceae bacterium]